MNNNYYLNLLYKKIIELKKVLQNLEDSPYSNEYKKYLISGHIITLDSILEIGISDLHSPELDELTSLIYYTRQKAVHYGFFNGMHNVENTANKIIELAESQYEKEKKFYSSLFDPKNFTLSTNNVLIKDSPNITSSPAFYKLSSLDATQELWIPAKKVFTLTKKSKDKISSYIIDLDAKASLYQYDENNPKSYKEITGDELKTFLSNNFTIKEENYNKHNETISEIIENFTKDPINSIQIMEFASNEQFCKNTIDVIRDFIMERTMFDAYIENNHLIKDKYSLSKMQKTDYTKLQHSFKKMIPKFATQKDAFFIDMTIKRAKYYLYSLGEDTLENAEPQLLSAILIQLFETGPKHFSNQFISTSPEFKKCYSNLQRYRQIFSHYLLNTKEYNDALNKFKIEFKNFIKLLQTIDLDDIRNPVHENYETYSVLERNKSDFFNFKHEQFLKLDNNSYIGKKIYYSSKNQDSDSLIAIIPYGTHASNILYYEKDAYDYLRPAHTIDDHTGKKAYVHVSKQAIEDAVEVKIDFNLSNLFTAYSILRKVKSNGDIQIQFFACKENDNYSHYDNLENVILRFFIQGYLPVELLRKTKIDTSNADKGIIYLKDSKDNIIANIINKKKNNISQDSHKDEKRFFSRIDDIKHDFSKRRHSK